MTPLLHLRPCALRHLPRLSSVTLPRTTAASLLRPSHLRELRTPVTLLSRFASTKPTPATPANKSATLPNPPTVLTPAPSSPTPSDPPGVSYLYPSRLLFYYAGKRTIYLGTLKLYSVLLFAYSALLVAPTLSFPSPLSLSIILGSALPFVAFQWFSPPYVTHAYLQLPNWARVSEEGLKKYVRGLKGPEKVELATIRWFGRPKVREMEVGGLRWGRERLGCVNLRERTGEGRWYVDPRGSPAGVQRGVEGVTTALMERILEWTKEEDKTRRGIAAAEKELKQKK